MKAKGTFGNPWLPRSSCWFGSSRHLWRHVVEEVSSSWPRLTNSAPPSKGRRQERVSSGDVWTRATWWTRCRTSSYTAQSAKPARRRVVMLTLACYRLIDAPRRSWKSLARDTQQLGWRSCRHKPCLMTWHVRGRLKWLMFFTSMTSWQWSCRGSRIQTNDGPSGTSPRKRRMGTTRGCRIRQATDKSITVFLLLTGGCENSLWKTIRRTIEGTDNSVRSDGRVSSDFSERSIQTAPIWEECITWNISWICIDRGVNVERRYSDCWSGRIGENGRIRNLSATSQCQRSTDLTEMRRIYLLNGRWYSKIVRKRLRIPRTHSKTGTDCRVWSSRWSGQTQEITLKHGMTFGLFQETSFIVITLNLVLNFTCRRKKHSQFHWNILM